MVTRDSVGQASTPPGALAQDVALRLRIALGCAFAGIVGLLLWGQTPDPYITTQLAYTYEHGLIPRGLWGSLVDAVGLMPRAVVLTGLSAYAALVALTSWALGRASRRQGSWTQLRITVAAGVLLSPAGFPFLAANLGRLDTPLLLLGGAALLAASSSRKAAPVAVVVLLAATPLVHEAALLAVAPVAVAWTWGERGRVTALTAAGAAVLTTAVVALTPMPIPMEHFADWLADRIARPDPFAVQLPYQGLDEAVTRGTRHISQVGLTGAGRHAVLPVLPLLVLCALALRHTEVRWRELEPSQRAMLVACGAPLLLGFLGTDLGRWWAFAGLELGVVAMRLVPPGSRASRGVVLASVTAVATTAVIGPITI